MKDKHPDQILVVLKKRRPRLRCRLDILHAACRVIHEQNTAKPTVYSTAEIGQISSRNGGINLNGLHRKNGAVYMELITAWARWDNGAVISPRKKHGQTYDPTFAWVHLLCPGPGQQSPLERWRGLAERYMKHLNLTGVKGISEKLYALRSFLEHYLWVHKFIDPTAFVTLPKGTTLPSLRGEQGQAPFRLRQFTAANHIHDFVTWVILNDDSLSSDEDGYRVALPGVRNPLPRANGKGGISFTESVRTVLPYKYIMDLRAILAPGEHFRDWLWAHNANTRGSRAMAGAWFEVSPKVVDENDPDCVWRKRVIVVRNWHLDKPNPNVHMHCRMGTREITEMWSPVVAVSLLLKLELPLRTFQVRMLDSGESDAERVELSGDEESPFVWAANPQRQRLLEPLLIGDASRVSKEQGVFRKFRGFRSEQDMTGFFINTNKTADIDKDWAKRGYQISWQHPSMLRWLIKLRNWQEKYNPVAKPTLWTELHIKHLRSLRSDAALASAPPTCFLFREAIARDKTKGLTPGDETKPISDNVIDSLWDKLLAELEGRQMRAGERDAGGSPIRFIKSTSKQGAVVTFYPLHALRVSLITALAFEGGVPLQTLMKLAGHSRLVMTIYYAKISAAVMTETMQKAQEQMAERADAQAIGWLKERSYAELGAYVVCDEASVEAALPAEPKDRTSTGWLRVLGGWCLVGGNTVADTVRLFGGCWNGGTCIKDSQNPALRIYTPIKPRQCIEGGCRWFVSRPEYLPEIKAKMDLLLAGLSQEQARFNKFQAALESLQAEKCQAEQEDVPFTRMGDLSATSNLYEKSAAALNDILNGIGHTAYLLERCVNLAKKSPADGPEQIVSAGTLADIQWALTSTDSELLQLAGICLNAEIYPELEGDSGAAILRRSQLLDRILEPEHGQPLLLSSLTPDDQLRMGNRILRALAKNTGGRMEPVIELLDSGKCLPAPFRESLDHELSSHALPTPRLAHLLNLSHENTPRQNP